MLQPLNGYAPNRLAVYARLVRNNIFGFIDRCFVEAPKTRFLLRVGLEEQKKRLY